MTGERLGRRRLLAAVGTGLATGLAGCGYQAAAGDFDWSESIGRYGRSPTVTWFGDGTHLYGVFERTVGPFGPSDGTVHVYDSSGQRVWSESPDASRHGDPAIADGAVFVPLEDGTVVRLEHDGDEQRQTRTDSAAEDGQTAWTTKWYRADERDASDAVPDDGGDDEDQVPALSLEASDALVAGAHATAVVAFDATDGDELFYLSVEDAVSSATDDESDGQQVRDLAITNEFVWAALKSQESDDTLLVGIDANGSIVADVELDTSPDWFETLTREDGPLLLLAVDDELRALDQNGELVYTTPLESTIRSHDPTIVETDVSSRLYHSSGNSLTAIDLETGEREWHRDDVRFSATPAATADGIYGHGTLEATDGRGCNLIGITADGDDWWVVDQYEDVDCGDELFFVDDRLVAVTDEMLYGFRREPGSRYTVL
ncbi:PQQ-binding-like beta-propeller repeat protein [Natrialbaceae archaeon A-arb3/5]